MLSSHVRKILVQVSFILYTYLDFPRSTEFFLPKNVNQSVHLSSSKTAGEMKILSISFNGTVSPGEGSHLEKLAIMIIYNFCFISFIETNS